MTQDKRRLDRRPQDTAGRSLPGRTPRRIRWTLLVLLWAWAACMFLVVDLFWTVEEFDRIRPRATLYRAMRCVAHDVVGGPCPEGLTVRPTARAATSLDRDGRLVAMLDDLRAARKQRRDRSFEGLVGLAQNAASAQGRAEAIRALAEEFGGRARPALLLTVRDPREGDSVRATAALSLAWTGEGAREALEGLLRLEDLPAPVRAGVLQALASHTVRLGTG